VVTVFSSLASKLVVTISPSLASKPVVSFLVEPQNQGGGGFPGLDIKTGSWFGDLGIKITVTISWFGSQNQVGFSLSVAPQNRRREVGAGHASRSSGLLDVEASLARVFQSVLKTSGDATMGGARGIIAEVASEAS
jgi:O-glycosyl hydrolase